MNPREYRHRARAAVAVVGALALGYVGQTAFLRQGDVLDGAFLLAFAGLLLLTATRRIEKIPDPPLRRGQVLVLMTVILLVAAGLRLWDLASIPQGVWFDEAENGIVATRILTDPGFKPLYIGDLTQLPAFFFYYLAWWISVAGHDILAVRLASAALGLLTIPLLYQLGRELFGQRVGLIAAFLLAVSRWHVNFSRFGMNGIAAPFFLVAALYFLARGLRTRRSGDFVLGGLAIGLGLNTYLAFNAAPFLIGLWLIHVALVSRLRLITRDWRLVGTAVVVAFLVFAPLGIFAVEHRAEFLERTQTASLFTGKTPDEARAALISNIVQHVEMFNVRGDRNGRHNLAGAPELDDVTGALFVLGIVLAAARWRRPSYLLLLLWLGIMLLPGILSLDFEAPQSYRSIGVVPVTALLAALPVAAALRVVSGWLGRASLRPLGVIAAAGLLCAGYANAHTYWFVQIWDNASWAEFSTQPTLIAREVDQLGPGYAMYLDPNFVDVPTLQFLAPQLKASDQHVFDPGKDLPFASSSGGVAVFVSDLNQSWIDALHRDYPSATFLRYRVSPNAPTILYAAIIPPEQVDAPRGLVGQYAAGPAGDAKPVRAQRDRAIDFDWRQKPLLPLPFTVDWSGTLAAPTYGNYVFRLDAPADAILKIDQADLVHGGEQKSVRLAQGTHQIEVSAAIAQPGQVRLFWQPPGGPMEVVPDTALFAPPVKDRGLEASYFTNANWSGTPTLEQIDPDISKHYHLLPLAQPFSVQWTGKIDIPTTGIYRFGTQSIDYSWLSIDGTPVVDNSRERDHYAEGAVNLKEGLHDIQIRFVDESGNSFVDVYWTPPGGSRILLPGDRLFPPAAAYPERAGPLQNSAPVFAPSPTASTPASSAPAQPQAAPVPSGPSVPATLPLAPLKVLRQVGAPGDGPANLKDPRGVAVDAKGNVYVVDTGHQVVKKFDPNGTYLATIGAPGSGDPNAVPEGKFIEPVAAAFDPAGNLLVLDSTTGWISRFGPDGTYQGRFGGPAAQFYHPRDLKVDAQGNVYAADAGTSHVTVFDPQGALVKREGDHGKDIGQIMEPVSAAPGPSNELLVVDTLNDRLTLFDASLHAVGVWSLTHSSSVEGPHLAMTSDGGFYLSDPPNHRVVHFDPSGKPIEQLGAGDQLGLPVGIDATPNGDVYVADSASGRVVVFGP